MSSIGMYMTNECNNHSLNTCMCLADAIDPLLDTEPVDVRKMWSSLFQRKFSAFKSVAALARTGEIILPIIYMFLHMYNYTRPP